MTNQATPDEVPEGFEPHFRKSKFTDPWEPLYSKREPNQVRIGVRLRDTHCNSRGLVHGAFLTALADNAIGLSCGLALTKADRDANGLVTTNLSVDFLGRAQIGEWIATDVEVIKTGKLLCVATCLIVGEDGRAPIARANATFQIL